MTPAPPPRGEARAALDTARKAAEAGDFARARTHVLHARDAAPLWREPLEAALAWCGDAPMELALWSADWLDLTADARGEFAIPGELRGAVRMPEGYARVLRARAQAAEELTRLATEREAAAAKRPEEAAVARWARALACDIASHSPALLQSLPPYQGWPAVSESTWRSTLRALERQMESDWGAGRTADALRAARVLQGLAVQSGFDDLQGERPKGMQAHAKAAASVLARARAQLTSRSQTPWTVEDLEWLDSDEGDAFTRAHPDFGVPAVAVSPRGWYRVETDCGVGTLRGVASDVERHHQRLANWYGSDPFVGKPGLVRIVPEAAGLESEGSPFWWAGGFQSGDTTTLRFSCGTIEGLGHGLTHELTHRFDGALYPGIPAWLAEGRAVWTGAAYAGAADERFVANHASFGTIEAAFIKGYGGLDKLTELVSGTIEDYRDNYTAGYALYVFLTTWDPRQKARYAARMESFMTRRPPRATPLEWFLASFCDGADGRPADLAGLSKEFGEFVSGFYWRDRKPFTSAYAESAGPAPEDGYVYDAPTWTWSRARAEPWFGQGQAVEAARLLARGGDDAAAIDAYAWASAADGRSPMAEREYEALLAKKQRHDAAWCQRQLRRFPAAPSQDDPPPFLGGLPKLRELAAVLDEVSGAAAKAGEALLAQRLAAEAARLSAHLGKPHAVAPVAVDRSMASAFSAAARPLAPTGFVEDGLTGYEERRVPGLWYVDAEGDLHVGREKPRDGSGQIDRAAHQRDAFARTSEWNLAGAWRFDARLRFSTSYASAAVVIGHQRREQGVRFAFSGGDFLYAIGAKEQEPTFDRIGFHLTGGFEREGPVGTPRAGGEHRFASPRTSFELTLIVDGPRVDAYIDGEPVGGYCMVDGTPVEGHIGFATGHGAIVVERPRVRRLDRERACGTSRWTPTGVALSEGESVPLRDAEGRRFSGQSPPSQGALAVVVPRIPLEEDGTVSSRGLERVRRWGEDIADELERAELVHPIWLFVPPGLPSEGQTIVEELRKRFAALPQGQALLFEHRLVADDDETLALGRTPWILFVDGFGIVRRAGSFTDLRSVLASREWSHVFDVFRENGAPQRRLPTPVRRSEATPEPEPKDGAGGR